MLRRFSRSLPRILSSDWFFWCIIGFFIFEALWIALSAIYPMAFDEDFHFGLIRIYARHWTPFLATHPIDGDAYGALTRDPSYLYHYLMSFPYRLLIHLTSSQTLQIIILRLLNIGMFTGGLLAFRLFLRRSGLSTAMTNGALLLFVLVPIVPLLAGQINYDNLLFVLFAWICLRMQTIFSRYQQQQLALQDATVVIIVSLLACLVKYAFLPILAVIGVTFVVLLVQAWRQGWLAAALVPAWKGLRLWVVAVVALSLVAAGGLFIQRYGVNLARYHNPIPGCSKVLSVEQCSHYGPWARNHLLEQTKGADFKPQPVYMWWWLYGMWYRTFFTINGNVANPQFRFQNYYPLPLVGYAGVALIVAGVAVGAAYWRRLVIGRPVLVFVAAAIILYIAGLFYKNLEAYVSTTQALGLNGRYLLLIALPSAAIIGRALSLSIGRRPVLKAWLAFIVIVCFLEGGGLTAFIVRSNPAWYWPNQTVQDVNHGAQRVLKPLIIGSNDRMILN